MALLLPNLLATTPLTLTAQPCRALIVPHSWPGWLIRRYLFRTPSSRKPSLITWSSPGLPQHSRELPASVEGVIPSRSGPTSGSPHSNRHTVVSLRAG